MKKALFLALVMAPLVATPSVAVAGKPVDNYAASAILSGDLAGAEARLRARLEVAPEDNVAMINLATIYRRTDRAPAADVLYDRILGQPDELLNASDGKVFRAHDIARVKRGAPLTLAAR